MLDCFPDHLIAPALEPSLNSVLLAIELNEVKAMRYANCAGVAKLDALLPSSAAIFAPLRRVPCPDTAALLPVAWR